MEMAGPSSSVNNALEATRRGGQVVLFGVKDGNLTIPKFSRYIVKGLTLHCVIGRRIFETWQISQRILFDKSNGIQDKIWNIILKNGEGTVLPLSKFEPSEFEKSMNENVKIIFDMQK